MFPTTETCPPAKPYRVDQYNNIWQRKQIVQIKISSYVAYSRIQNQNFFAKPPETMFAL
jgi:hypothetical protein